MLFCTFHSKLKKLNRDLFIDCNNEVRPYHKDFAHAGLYKRACNQRGAEYIMGVPHSFVPEHTIEGVDSKNLEMFGFSTVEKDCFYDTDYIENVKVENNKAVEGRVLAKGYIAILSELVAKNMVDRRAAEREFGTSLEPNRKVFPKRYISI